MRAPTFADALGALMLKAKDGPRRDALFGDGYERACEALPPFMVGEEFPDVYLEFPLAGDPYLDATVIPNGLKPGTRIDSFRAAGTEDIIDWFAGQHAEQNRISFGYEIDTATPETTPACVHFQPRMRTDLVRPFCEAAGEPERADLYLNQNARMPSWPLSYFGLFRGRPKSPLRVCGYLTDAERRACSEDPCRIRDVFVEAGFTSFDDSMLHEVSTLMGMATDAIDFQFDVLPDGSLSDVFSIEVCLPIVQAAQMVASFMDGPAARLMTLLETWGLADERWRLVADATFTTRLPSIGFDDGTVGSLQFLLTPRWVKVRWKDGQLALSKLYYYLHATFS